uniref:Uncharacterized protein n=1 Tax=Anguilla anguilla TaxID=7936 RepID=A0A0E9QEH0_ANGAN
MNTFEYELGVFAIMHICMTVSQL